MVDESPSRHRGHQPQEGQTVRLSLSHTATSTGAGAPINYRVGAHPWWRRVMRPPADWVLSRSQTAGSRLRTTDASRHEPRHRV